MVIQRMHLLSNIITFGTTTAMESGSQGLAESTSISGEARKKAKSMENQKKIVCQTRCNPKLNYRLLEKLKGEPSFRKALVTLGLESMLHLQVTRLRRDLCVDLARKVDVERAVLCIHGKDIPLTYESVTKILGLSCCGWSISNKLDYRVEEVASTYRKFNLDRSGRTSTYSLLSFLEENGRFDDEFRAKFLLFTTATMLKPTTNVHIHFREFVPLLNGMDCLGEFNWAKFLLDGLLDSVSGFQVKGAKSLGGCLLYLQLVYFHCISPLPWSPYDGLLMATPTLRYWTDERVSSAARRWRDQGGLQSDKVMVRSTSVTGIDAAKDTCLQPQLLMHEVALTRLKRRLDANDSEMDTFIREVKKVVHTLASKIQHLESCRNTQKQF